MNPVFTLKQRSKVKSSAFSENKMNFGMIQLQLCSNTPKDLFRINGMFLLKRKKKLNYWGKVRNTLNMYNTAQNDRIKRKSAVTPWMRHAAFSGLLTLARTQTLTSLWQFTHWWKVKCYSQYTVKPNITLMRNENALADVTETGRS